MKFRTSCILAAVAIFAFGTMASANIHTITQTLYYESTAGANGVGGASPFWDCSGDGGNPSFPACDNLLKTDFNPSVTYTFHGFGFYSTGFNLSTASVVVTDHTVGTMTVTNDSGANHYFKFAVGAIAEFSLNSALLTNAGTAAFFTDQLNAASSAGGGTSTCSQSGGGVGTDGNTYDSTGCLFLTSGGSSSHANVGGYMNTPPTGTGQSTSAYSGNSNVNIYEAVQGNFSVTGASGHGNGASFAGSEVQLVYTYDDGIHSATPEPATLLLLGSGLSFLGAKLRRRAARS
jgi:hypothetical protein